MTIIHAIKKITPSIAARRPEWPEGWALRSMMFGGPVLLGPEKSKDTIVQERLYESDYLANDWEMVDLLADKEVGV